MQIVETNLFRVLTPDKGYKLVNKTTNKEFNKVYLGVHDSIDNYIEVIDDEYVDVKYKIELNELKDKVINDQNDNDLNLDVVLLSIAKIYEMFEPFLAMMPMTMNLDEEITEQSNPLINLYLCLVKRDLMDIDNIPETFKEDVMKLL